jgi:hypothetical protein
MTPCEMEAHSPVPFCNHDCELHHTPIVVLNGRM